MSNKLFDIFRNKKTSEKEEDRSDLAVPQPSLVFLLLIFFLFLFSYLLKKNRLDFGITTPRPLKSALILGFLFLFLFLFFSFLFFSFFLFLSPNPFFSFFFLQKLKVKSGLMLLLIPLKEYGLLFVSQQLLAFLSSRFSFSSILISLSFSLSLFLLLNKIVFSQLKNCKNLSSYLILIIKYGTLSSIN